MSLMILNGIRYYMPAARPSETPEARQARHLRRLHQVLAGNVEAPPEAPAPPVAGPDAVAPTQEDSQ